ncbi:septum formation initiator family protein [Paenibacillus sp. N1-5-1-14]|uniref:septum formation initiator family protein n=1 Tax=Paenibacillus radicibacter TaxID=2972488 RepID=UPI0021595174|nr:septum formation initiator family protein [Paenibacillus radicibacter]MCR8641924.1 septum formation initiator family protein [Paenibacillus radicibacter]
MAYYQGNLALDEKKRPQRRKEVPKTRTKTTKQQQTYPSRKTQPRVSSIPTKVKLTRLACVALIAIVSVLVMWRYTQLYQTSLSIKKTQQQIKALHSEVSTLKQQVETLQSPERLQQKAEELGFSQSHSNVTKTTTETNQNKTGKPAKQGTTKP